MQYETEYRAYLVIFASNRANVPVNVELPDAPTVPHAIAVAWGAADGRCNSQRPITPAAFDADMDKWVNKR